MANAARWIRFERNCGAALRAAFAGFARAQPARAAPAVFWAEEEGGGHVSALVAPLRFVPGRPRRWCAWALAPLVASYRSFGFRAYLEGDAVCLSGGRIATCEAKSVGACAVLVSSFLLADPSFMDAFRNRIEAQRGWQFDHSWPTADERAAIEGAQTVESAGAA
jgi:hypothetical protein